MGNEFGIITGIFKEINDVRIEYRRRGVLEQEQQQLTRPVITVSPAPIPVLANISLFSGDMLTVTETTIPDRVTTLVPCPGFTTVGSIEIDRTQVPSTQTNFQLTIRVTDSRLKTFGSGGFVLNASGFDIRPYSMACTALVYELEENGYDLTTGTVLMHVVVPSVNGAETSSNTSILLNWGNALLTTDGSSSLTWTPFGYTSVLHMNEIDTMTRDSVVLPSTSFNRWGAGTVVSATGQIGNAGAFNGINGSIVTGNATSPFTNLLLGTSDFTVSLWANTTTDTRNLGGRLNILIQSGFKVSYWWLGIRTGKFWVDIRTNGWATAQTVTGNTSVIDGAWHYLVVTRVAGVVKLYVDGVLDVTDTGSGTVDLTNDGGDHTVGDVDNAQQWWNGYIDEWRTIQGTALSANRILAEYRNQLAPNTFYSFT